MITFEHVTFSYDNAESGVTDIDFTVQDGECVLLCGSSGCGKTTLTKMMNGLIPSFYTGKLEGTVSINGKNLADMQIYEISRMVSSVFQNPKTQFFNTDAESEITFPLENRGMDVKEIDRRLKAVTAEFGIEKLLTKSLFEMSGGEQQIIAFASAYISDTDIIVLDEPSANLDAGAMQTVRRMLLKMKQAGKSIIVAEHRLAYLNGIVDTVYYLENGRLTHSWTASDFYSMPDAARRDLSLRDLHESAKIPQLPDVYTLGTDNSTAGNPNALTADQLLLKRGKITWDYPVNFQFQMGKIICVVGENGMGKSTFLRTLAGLEKEQSGAVLLNSKVLRKKQRRRTFGMVMQNVDHQLFSDTVAGECRLGNGAVSDAEIAEILDLLQLSDYQEQHPQSLSGGQRQRVTIAAVLLSGKQILLLDEPTSGLDYGNMMTVSRALRAHAAKGGLCIVVTHDAELIRALYA